MPYSTLLRIPRPCPFTDVVGSEEMSFVQLFIPSEIARTTVSMLGELGSIEFLDVSSSLAGSDRVVEQRDKCIPKELCQGNKTM